MLLKIFLLIVSVAILSGCFLDATPSTPGRWNLGDGSGTTATDSGGNGNDGILENGPVWVDGLIGKALEFDGVDDYVDFGNDESLRMKNEFTVSLWINAATSQEGFYNPISKGHEAANGWALQGSKATLSFLIGDGTGNPGATFSQDLRDEHWHHLVMTKSSSSGIGIKLYLDGAPDGSNPDATGDVARADSWNLSIGRDTQNGRYFKGSIDEVRIYGRVLTAVEVSDLYSELIRTQSPRQ